MRTKPIQLTDAAFPMLRKAISRLDERTGLRVGAADIVPAAELIEAGYVEYMRVSEIPGRRFR
jgi:hypothetical protein